MRTINHEARMLLLAADLATWLIFGPRHTGPCRRENSDVFSGRMEKVFALSE